MDRIKKYVGYSKCPGTAILRVSVPMQIDSLYDILKCDANGFSIIINRYICGILASSLPTAVLTKGG